MLGMGLGLQKGRLSVWTPNNIPGLKIWLEPDFGISMDADDYEVNSWVDHQGNANLAQTLTKRPLWVASVALANNQPGVQFDGVNDAMGVTLASAITPPHTIICISTELTDTDVDRAVFSTITSFYNAAVRNYYTYSTYAGDVVAGNPLARWRLETSAASAKYYKNGVLEFSGAVTGVDITRCCLGSYYLLDRWYGDVTIICFIVYDHIITADELAQLNIWLVAKFGVGV